MVNDPLLARLLASQPAPPFVTLVHWLERLIGTEVDDAARGPIALRHDPSLGFQARELDVVPREDAVGLAVITAFAGITGAVSPLPTPLLEALARDDERELPEHALLDVMQHRLLALLYRGLRAQDLAREGGAQRAEAWLLALAGLADNSLTSTTSLSRSQVLALAPLLIAHPPTATRLRIALRDQLDDLLDGAPLSIHQLHGGAVALSPEARPRLGRDTKLGKRSTLGARCPVPAAAIAITLGPLSAHALVALRPGGERASHLSALVRLLVPESIEVEITLRPATPPAARLGRTTLRGAWLAGEVALPSAARFTLS